MSAVAHDSQDPPSLSSPLILLHLPAFWLVHMDLGAHSYLEIITMASL